jgi:hypothetical protein
MALIFPILTQFDDRATKKADQAFTKLGRKFAAVFSVGAVVKFGKDSVRAFMEAEKEAQQLRATLEAINLGFAAPLLDEYIDKLELLSGRTGDELTRAFSSLSLVTQDVTTAQNLLNLSLDVAAGTGKSLTTIATALQRAYKGETTALARLRIGYTTAELKGKQFEEVVAELQDRFTGASADAADTFAGKLQRLRNAADQAKEAFGAGFVNNLEASGKSIEDLQNNIIQFGESLGTVAGAVTNFGEDVVEIMQNIYNNPATQAVLDVFDALTRGIGFVVTGELVPTMDAADARRRAEERRKAEESNRATLRQRNALIRAEKSIVRERQKQNKLADKDKKDAEKLAKAKAMFDMEQIQIAAALQGKLTEEERTRLLLMQAIIAENGSEAERLTEKLKKLQSDTEKLANTLITMKAGDPFSEWDTYFKEAGDMIAALFAKLQNLSVATNQMVTESRNVQAARQAGVVTAKEERVIAFGEAARQTETMAQIAAEQAAVAIAEAIAAQAAATSAAEKAAADAFLEGAQAAQDAAKVLAESVVAAYEAEALAAASLATELEFEAMAAVAALPPITVNVSGNVISEYDLAQTIINEQYQYQRSGGKLTFNQVAI